MTAEYLRDAAAAAAVLAYFASAWFGWAQESPPRAWRGPLILAAAGSVLIAVLGGVLTWRHWAAGTVFDQVGTPVTFGVIVGVEVVAAGIGAIVLRRRRRSELTAVWIALVVGVHFVPLAWLLAYPMLYPVAAAVVAVAATSGPVARSRALTPSVVTGLGTGSVLLAAALFSLTTVLLH